MKETRKGKDGDEYIILAVEKDNQELPQMSRYTVRRVRDGAQISNFPGYLLDAITT